MAPGRSIHGGVHQFDFLEIARRQRLEIRLFDTSCNLQIGARILPLPTVLGTFFFLLVPVSMAMHQSLV